MLSPMLCVPMVLKRVYCLRLSATGRAWGHFAFVTVLLPRGRASARTATLIEVVSSNAGYIVWALTGFAWTQGFFSFTFTAQLAL